MLEERESKEPAMNPFRKNESKETFFLPVSTDEASPQPPSLPKKPPPKICGSNYPLSIAFIVVNEFCERFSFYGMKAVLTLYFLYFLHWSEDTSTSVYHAFSSLCYITPILGAAIADSWLGKFKVLSLVGLSLIALGTGGIKPCVAAFGGDQFEQKHEQERARYFSVFYLSINAGSLLSTFITPMLRGDVQCFGGDCYALAFGVPGLLMVIALVVFAIGSKMYKKTPPEGNILSQVVKCIWFAASNRFKNRSGDNAKREHWLDWAAEKYPKQLIMDVKALTRVLFLYIPLPMFWALLDQQGSRWTLQATRMNGNLGFIVLQPEQMQVLNPLLVLIFIPLFDVVIYRLVSKCGINFSREAKCQGSAEKEESPSCCQGQERLLKRKMRSLRKMAVGMILACLAFVVVAVVEIKINEMAPPQPGPQEIFLRVLNLADDEVKVTMMGDENNSLLEQSIKSFQKMSHYSKFHLKTKSKDFHFHLKYHNLSVYTEHSVKEKSWYSLVIREDGKNISSMMVKDAENITTNGMSAVRFVNTLHKEVNISLGTDSPLSVDEDYGVSAYRTMQTGEYPAVQCKTEDNGFLLNLGLLDFGAAYLFVITNSTNQGPQAWKMEDIPANKISIAWQLPQYALLTAGEVMFSVTGLEFSYSQAPSSMKSVLQAAWLLTIGVGNFIVLAVAQFSGLVQWAEFIMFSCLLLVVCLVFSIMAHYYVPVKPEDIQELAEKQIPHIQRNMINQKTKSTKL
ncbi:PREDICTED: solute carrier family 15 member 2 isoform X3 [Hipposideros armiger]|uniref:Solute carrier family 15 member 2 n=1 Tax=Hipposideros armiger TaxID=186990 RepID=A0A8B7S2R5_HIPAR|nr:PREDICTED: solute carrier family 15 member 2 isoform X3 [Hipposideros armiger]